MTVVETLISATVGFMMLATVATLMVRGLDMWTTGQQRASSQQGALLAIHRMTWELQASDVKSVSLYARGSGPNRDGLSFLSAMRDGVIQHDENGEILWQKFVVFYHDPDTSTIRRQEVPIETPTRDPDPLKLDDFVPSTSDKVVANGIASLSSNLSSLGGNPVVLNLRGGDANQSSSLVGSIVMENGFLKSNPRGRRLYFQAFVIPRSLLKTISLTFRSNTLTILRRLTP